MIMICKYRNITQLHIHIVLHSYQLIIQQPSTPRFSSPYSTSNICPLLSGTERFSGAHKRGNRGLGPANKDRQNSGPSAGFWYTIEFAFLPTNFELIPLLAQYAGVIILLTQKMHYHKEIPENIFHTFALFDPPKMGNLPSLKLT